jgi:serine/threonine protein phosphatase PrpC
MYVAVSGRTDTGVVRSNNEDAFALLDLSTGERVEVAGHTLLEVGPRGMLLVVSDGMGGEKAGEVASALVIDALREHLEGDSAEDDMEALLESAALYANEMVLAAAKEHAKHGMGATLTAVLLHKTYACTAQVGDSRAYVLRKGELTQITKDQTYMQVLIDKGALDPEAARRSQAKNVILQAIGKADTLVVAQHRFPVRQGDRLLVCSDGLFSQVTDAEIRDVLAGDELLDEAGEQLVELANERGGKDNVTVVVASLAGDELTAATDGKVADTLETIRAFTLGGG